MKSPTDSFGRANISDGKDATFPSEPTKEIVKIALSMDVIEGFEAMGEGWESKVDEALRWWLEKHKAS